MRNHSNSTRLLLLLCCWLLLITLSSQTSDDWFELSDTPDDRLQFFSGGHAPSCGLETNATGGCLCNISDFNCRRLGDAVACPASDTGGCATSAEGVPVCALGGESSCESSADCMDGQVCIWVGRSRHNSLCKGFFDAPYVCADVVGTD